MGLAPLRGGWGRGGVPTQQDPPMIRCPAGMRETLGEMGVGCRGMEGNAASTFPVHLAQGSLLGSHLILCPQSLPPAAQNPSPAPTPPPRALCLHSETPSETPSNVLGLNPTYTPSSRALAPNSGTPHSGGPPLDMLPFPFHEGPKQRACPRLEHHPHLGPTPRPSLAA